MAEKMKESERLKKFKRKRLFRILEIALIVMVILGLFSFIFYDKIWKGYFEPEEISWSEMVTRFGFTSAFGVFLFENTEEIEKIEEVMVRDPVFIIKWKDESQTSIKFRVPYSYYTIAPMSRAFMDQGVKVGKGWSYDLETSVLLIAVPAALVLSLIAIFWWAPRRFGTTFGKRKSKKIESAGIPETRFTDVAGIDEAVEEIKQVMEQLKTPEKYEAVGAEMIKGVLLVGPPGCGKTLLARAVAGETGVSFIVKSGSDFVEQFVGVGPKAVRDLFDEAKANIPCIIFIDEIDSIGKARGDAELMSGAQSEREQTLNQLCVEMDGFNPKLGIVVLAATNRPDILDPALKRKGRFDREITVSKPDIKGRKEILDVHTKNKPLAEGIDLTQIARGTIGFSGADLADLANKAAIQAAELQEKRDESQKGEILMEDLQYARDQILMGEGQERRQLSQEEKEHSAYYEAAKVIVAKSDPLADPVYKVSTLPRGFVLGKTQFLPEEEQHHVSDKHILAKTRVHLAGRAAEEILKKEGSHIQESGRATDDLQKATQLVKKMICELGMDEKFGPRVFGKKEELGYKDSEITRYHRDFSEAKAKMIDKRIKEVILSCLEYDKRVLVEKRGALGKLAEELFDKEELEGKEIDEILKNENFSNLH